jgi:septal ring factor EnvC (AmiA/AmiB activator)
MKRTLATAAVLVACLCFNARAVDSSAAAEPQTQQTLKLVKELQEQQAQIADNQTKLEAKLAVVAEAVREARIYASRGGHK